MKQASHEIRWWRTYVLVAILTSSLVGCRGSRNDSSLERAMPGVFPNHSVSQVRDFVIGKSDTLSSFKARASVSVRSPEQSARFGSHIDYRRADSLYLNVRASLGIEAARALVTPDSFFVYDRIKRKLYFGDIEKADAVLPLPISGSGVFEMLLGIEFRPEQDWSMTADSAHYLFRSRDNRTVVSVDPRFWRVSSYVRLDPNGAVEEERTYSDFSDFDGVVLPRRLVLSRPPQDTFASIYYNTLELNPPCLDLKLSVSDRAEKVYVR